MEAFLSWLAVERNVAVATQNQAMNALMRWCFCINRFWNSPWRHG
ncbi:MAG: phage integrase N-terminal SAM-like domain-containing protein [Candidatus Nitrosoglobus sp.]